MESTFIKPTLAKSPDSAISTPLLNASREGDVLHSSRSPVLRGSAEGLLGVGWVWTNFRAETPGKATLRKGSEFELSEIKLKKGEPVDRALRRLKKKVDREGTLKEVRNHRHYEKPSERRRRKMKVARFSAMLSARYADA